MSYQYLMLIKIPMLSLTTKDLVIPLRVTLKEVVRVGHSLCLTLFSTFLTFASIVLWFLFLRTFVFDLRVVLLGRYKSVLYSATIFRGLLQSSLFRTSKFPDRECHLNSNTIKQFKHSTYVNPFLWIKSYYTDR